MKETCAHILTRRMVSGSDPFYVKFWAKQDPVGAKTPIFNGIRSYSASAVTPSEKIKVQYH